MPPPEPKSSTVSPALSWASAVGLPQPSEASTASSGNAPVWETSYRFDVMGSQPSIAADAPQHELPPLWTRSAACAYFSFTTSLTSIIMLPSFKRVPERTGQHAPGLPRARGESQRGAPADFALRPDSQAAMSNA